MPVIKLTIALDNETAIMLDQLRDFTGAKRSESIRRAIRAYAPKILKFQKKAKRHAVVT